MLQWCVCLRCAGFLLLACWLLSPVLDLDLDWLHALHALPPTAHAVHDAVGVCRTSCEPCQDLYLVMMVCILQCRRTARTEVVIDPLLPSLCCASLANFHCMVGVIGYFPRSTTSEGFVAQCHCVNACADYTCIDSCLGNFFGDVCVVT